MPGLSLTAGLSGDRGLFPTAGLFGQRGLYSLGSVFTPTSLAHVLRFDMGDGSMLKTGGDPAGVGESIATIEDLAPGDDPGLYLPGVEGNTAVISDASIDAHEIIVHRRGNWNEPNVAFVSKDSNVQRDWFFYSDFAGLRFVAFATEGTLSHLSTTTVPFLDGEEGWVKVTANTTNGDVTFYTSEDGVVWTQLGAVVNNSPSITFTNNESDITIGIKRRPTNDEHFDSGDYFSVVIKDSIGGTPTLDIDFTTHPTGTTSFVCDAGQTVTIDETAAESPLIRAATDAIQTTASEQAVAFPLVDGAGYFYSPGVNNNEVVVPIASTNQVGTDLVFRTRRESGTGAYGVPIGGGGYTSGIGVRVEFSTGLTLYLYDGTVNGFTFANAATDLIPVGGGYKWLRFRVTSSEIILASSDDGVTWVDYGTEAHSITPNNVTELTVSGAGGATIYEGAFSHVRLTDTATQIDIVSIDFTNTDDAHGATTGTAETGQTWTMYGSDSLLVRKPHASFDATDDHYDIAMPAGAAGTMVLGADWGTVVAEFDYDNESVQMGSRGFLNNGNQFNTPGEIYALSYLEAGASQTDIDSLVSWMQTERGSGTESLTGITSLNSFAREEPNLTSLRTDWDTSAATTVRACFYRCSSLTAVDASGWDMSSVTNIGFFVTECFALTSLDVASWDTSGVTEADDFARQCTSLTTLDISGWVTSSCTKFEDFVYQSALLTTITITGGAGSPFRDSPCTNYTRAFSSCALDETTVNTILVEIDAAGTSGGTLDIDGGTNAAPTGAGATAKTNLQGRGWTVTTN